MGVHEFFLDQIVKWLGCKNVLRKVDKQERAPQESTQSVPAPIRSKSESDVHIVTVAPILKGKATQGLVSVYKLGLEFFLTLCCSGTLE